MPASLPEKKLTYDDYCRLPEDGRRHEVLDGDHVVTPAPLDRHQRIVSNLSWCLERHLRETGAGELRFAPFDVRLAEHSVAQPDLVVVLARSFDRPLILSADREDAVETELLPGLSLLLGEILDPGPAARARPPAPEEDE